MVLSIILAPHVPHAIKISDAGTLAEHIWKTKHVAHFMANDTDPGHILVFMTNKGRSAGIWADSYPSVF